jgi:hypothetical protein
MLVPRHDVAYTFPHHGGMPATFRTRTPEPRETMGHAHYTVHTFHHQESANKCGALSQNRLCCIRSSLIIRNVGNSTGAAHERSSRHYRVHY